jgi:hypothetical protein
LSGSIKEGVVQGPGSLKPRLLALAITVAMVLVFGPGSAFACDTITIDRTEAKAGETVNFSLSGCQLNDQWKLDVFFEKNAIPERLTLASGFADATTVEGQFALPADIGDTPQVVTLRLFVFRNAVELPPLELLMRYLPGGIDLPTNKAECKKGGYARFGFKNQGRCVAFVQPASFEAVGLSEQDARADP